MKTVSEVIRPVIGEIDEYKMTVIEVVIELGETHRLMVMKGERINQTVRDNQEPKIIHAMNGMEHKKRKEMCWRRFRWSFQHFLKSKDVNLEASVVTGWSKSDHLSETWHQWHFDGGMTWWTRWCIDIKIGFKQDHLNDYKCNHHNRGSTISMRQDKDWSFAFLRCYWLQCHHHWRKRLWQAGNYLLGRSCTRSFVTTSQVVLQKKLKRFNPWQPCSQ